MSDHENDYHEDENNDAAYHSDWLSDRRATPDHAAQLAEIKKAAADHAAAFDARTRDEAPAIAPPADDKQASEATAADDKPADAPQLAKKNKPGRPRIHPKREVRHGVTGRPKDPEVLTNFDVVAGMKRKRPNAIVERDENGRITKHDPTVPRPRVIAAAEEAEGRALTAEQAPIAPIVEGFRGANAINVREASRLFAPYLQEAINGVVQLARDSSNKRVQLAALQTIIERVLGKPLQQVQTENKNLNVNIGEAHLAAHRQLAAIAAGQPVSPSDDGIISIQKPDGSITFLPRAAAPDALRAIAEQKTQLEAMEAALLVVEHDEK